MLLNFLRNTAIILHPFEKLFFWLKFEYELFCTVMPNNFEITFAKIYPNFTKNIVEQIGNLTPQEIKVCMCIKMSYSNNQIREQLNISNNTLANLRSSIRHKGGLSRSDSLTHYILCL